MSNRLCEVMLTGEQAVPPPEVVFGRWAGTEVGRMRLATELSTSLNEVTSDGDYEVLSWPEKRLPYAERD